MNDEQEEKSAPEDTRSPVQKLYDRRLRELVDQHPKAVRKQVAKAFDNPPANPDEVDPWFLEHFHKAPVSYDTDLFNRLQAIKAELMDAVSASAG